MTYERVNGDHPSEITPQEALESTLGDALDDPLAAEVVGDDLLEEVQLPAEVFEPDTALTERPAFYNQVERLSLLSREEEIRLMRRIERGDEGARETFITSNLRLVMFVARKKQWQARQLEYDDLVEEGMFGLMRAVEKFDVSRGYKFSTYAFNWISQAMDRAIQNKDRTIRLPVHTGEKLARIRRSENKLTGEVGRPPSDKELAKKVGMPVAALHALQDIARAPVSLESPLRDDHGHGATLLKDAIADEDSSTEEQVLESDGSVAKRVVEEVLESFDERECEVLRLRHGLGGLEEHTLLQVCEKLGISRERVRQIQQSAESRFFPAVRARLAAQGYIGEIDEEETPATKTSNGRVSDERMRFGLHIPSVNRMVEDAGQVYEAHNRAVVENFLQRFKEGMWLPKAIELELLEEAKIPRLREQAMDAFKDVYLGVALIGAASHIMTLRQAGISGESAVITNVHEAFEDVITKNNDSAIKAALRDKLFGAAFAAAQETTVNLLQQAAA